VTVVVGLRSDNKLLIYLDGSGQSSRLCGLPGHPALLVEVCGELHVPALLSWFWGGNSSSKQGLCEPTLITSRKGPGAQETPSRLPVCWGGLEAEERRWEGSESG